jgi:hypothetical protein
MNREKIGHEAGVLWIEMLDEHKRHARIVRQDVQQ